MRTRAPAGGAGTINKENAVKDDVKKKKQVFPNVKVNVTNKPENVYAGKLGKDAKIELNVAHINDKSTGKKVVVEEYAHLWIELADRIDNQIINNLIQQIRKDGKYAEVLSGSAYESIAKGKSDPERYLVKEFLAQAIANPSTAQSFKSTLQKILARILQYFGIKKEIDLTKLTVDEFVTLVRKELDSSDPITKATSEDILAFLEGKTDKLSIENSALAGKEAKGKLELENYYGLWDKFFKSDINKKQKTVKIVNTGTLELQDALQLISTIKEKYPAFNYAQDGCYHRANLIIAELLKQDIDDAKKMFAISTIEKDGKSRPALKTKTEYITEKGNHEVEWHYHVAPFVKISIDGNISEMIIDPAVSNHPLTVSEWLSLISPNPGKFNKVDDAYIKGEAERVQEGKGEIFEGRFLSYKSNISIYFQTEKDIHDVKEIVKGNQPFETNYASSQKFIEKYNLLGKVGMLTQTIIDGANKGSLPNKTIQEIKQKYTLTELMLSLTTYAFALKQEGFQISYLEGIFFSSGDCFSGASFFYTKISDRLERPHDLETYNSFISQTKTLFDNKPELIKTKYPQLLELLYNNYINLLPQGSPKKANFNKDLFSN